MTKQVAYKTLSGFWCWYGDVVKTVSRINDDEHELAALDEVGEHSFDGLPLPSLDAKFFICGKEFEVRDALPLATMTVEQVVNDYTAAPDGWASIEDVRDLSFVFFCVGALMRKRRFAMQKKHLSSPPSCEIGG